MIESSLKKIELKHPSLLPPSRLYHLKPVNVGTAEVECLTGYISRLAQEHRVTPYILMLNEIAPLLEGYQAVAYRAKFSLFHRSINGVGRTAAAFVYASEELTKWDQLRLLTMLTWSEVLTSYGLIRSSRAWCPTCYEEQRIKNQTLYDPLLWTLELVKVCHKHEELLVSNCPTCDSRLPHLASRSRPGHCYRCNGYLGVLPRGKGDAASRHQYELEWEFWKSKAVGQLLATSNQFPPPSRANIAKSLNYCVDKYAWGRVSELSSLIDVGHHPLRSWLNGESLPVIETALRICFDLGLLPTSFLRGSLVGEKTFSDLNSSQRVNKYPQQISSKPSIKLAPSDVESKLIAALTSLPPQPLSTLMKITGWGRKRLKRHFPELCVSIIARYSELCSKRINIVKAKKILLNALEENPPPSLRQLIKRIDCKHSGTLYNNFPGLTQTLVQRYKKHWYKEVDWSFIESSMRDTLTENPPPSLQETARRLDLCEPPYHKFNDLCKAISQRYVGYIKDKATERREGMRQKVQNVITRIISEGEYPSRVRVNKRLDVVVNPRDFVMIVREMKKDQ
ncbi:MAG: hypothetical protein QOH63_4157 [Acidobacteriota bacterium]|nr:hypothetical protein [Acidobacteriota bacterium]